MRMRFDLDGAFHENRRKAVFVLYERNQLMDKPFKTLNELIALMDSRGLKTDKNTGFILKREGYYAVVNGYKDLFIDASAKQSAAGEDRYKEGTEFTELYSLFVMDRHLRNILFRYITLAEATLKTVATYEFCAVHKDNNEAYLDKANYRSDGRYPDLIPTLIGEMNSILGRKKKPTRNKLYLDHYINKHDNVPLWVIMNNLDLGQAFRFYDYLPESIRFTIARSFQALYKETHAQGKRITHKDLKDAFDHIKDFRNRCAHDERLYCARIDKSKSTTFKNVIDDLELVLTANQFNKLTNSIAETVKEATAEIHTVNSNDILALMGYSSFEEIAPLQTDEG